MLTGARRGGGGQEPGICSLSLSIFLEKIIKIKKKNMELYQILIIRIKSA
jgi:hypothetical protein